ncbi:MAG: non-heme iron oxygenase ferredoxin subunit [Alphaproteobacteria bacterium]|nr:non-heme iron oxygenase ferredoxin subunit [Alphaproteobacteria bacterium]
MEQGADLDWQRVAEVDEVDDDEPRQILVGGRIIALYKLGSEFYATDDTCTHEFASLCDGYIEGDTIECPLHQARFHIPTGKVLDLPAEEDLATYPVRVEGSLIYVGVPKT